MTEKSPDTIAGGGWLHEHFRSFGEFTAAAIGTPTAFFFAIVFIIAWAICGPFVGFSDTWQLIVNTSTTIVTFLIVFLIQSTQNRDTRILNLKLDELLRALEGARTSFCNLNEVTDTELEELHAQFSTLAERFEGVVGDDLASVRKEIAQRKAHNRN